MHMSTAINWNELRHPDITLCFKSMFEQCNLFNLVFNQLYLHMSTNVHRLNMFSTNTYLSHESLSRKFHLYYECNHGSTNLSMCTRKIRRLVCLTWYSRYLQELFFTFSCEIISPCGSSPCVRGTCRNLNSTTYQCVCELGYTGK